MSQKPTQQDLVYEFIKSKQRAFTHEVIIFGANNHINNAKERARDLKKDGLVWRMNEQLKKKLYPDTKEEIWSVIEADKQPPVEYFEKAGQLSFIT